MLEFWFGSLLKKNGILSPEYIKKFVVNYVWKINFKVARWCHGIKSKVLIY